jgi:hypothetical protein
MPRHPELSEGLRRFADGPFTHGIPVEMPWASE